MKKSELIRRLKAGAYVYVPLAVNGGKDWEYIRADERSLLEDLLRDNCFKAPHCSANETNMGAPVWFEPAKEKQ